MPPLFFSDSTQIPKLNLGLLYKPIGLRLWALGLPLLC